MRSPYVLSVTPIGKCPTMSQTSCGLQQLGRELSCLANKHGSLTKSKNDLRHGCAAPASASSLARRLPANFPSAELCFLLPAPAKAQVTGRSSGRRLASLLEYSPQDNDVDTVSLPALQFPVLLLQLGISNLHLLKVTFVPCDFVPCEPVVISSLHSDLLLLSPQFPPVFLTFLYFSERSRLDVYLWSEQINWHKDSRSDSKERIFIFFYKRTVVFKVVIFIYYCTYLFVYLSIYLWEKFPLFILGFPQNTWCSSCLSLLGAGIRASRLHTQPQSYFQRDH